ncbi:hypothetical protein [Aneurinibacillus tyrosinisolvens]|uniref:hypothetical protein n=1 Tax=Aneurinibacillus tyrosinisolvens TaxID=1443435 RepID=UPI00063F6352|nr:hypothetical protein [Aneurinibacillus tyrosinisolvens]
MLKKLREIMSTSPRKEKDWVVVFFDRNDFRLQAMKKRLEERGISVSLDKSAAIYVHENELDEAKQIVAEWVN